MTGKLLWQLFVSQMTTTSWSYELGHITLTSPTYHEILLCFTNFSQIPNDNMIQRNQAGTRNWWRSNQSANKLILRWLGIGGKKDLFVQFPHLPNISWNRDEFNGPSTKSQSQHDTRHFGRNKWLKLVTFQPACQQADIRISNWDTKEFVHAIYPSPQNIMKS